MNIRCLCPSVFARSVLGLLVLAQVGPAQSDYDLSNDRIVPLSAKRAGTNTNPSTGPKYQFAFTDAQTLESITYEVDTGHADFVAGLLRISELSSGAVLVRGGERFKIGDSQEFGTQVYVPGSTPPPGLGVSFLSGSTTFANGVLSLFFQHVYQSVTHKVCYEIAAEKGALRLRAYDALPTTAFNNNYFGFDPGIGDGQPVSEFLRIPYMEHIPVTMFRPGGDSLDVWFASSYVDLNQSYGGSRTFLEAGAGSDQPQNSQFVYYHRMSDGTINHAVDDVLWFTVSRQPERTFIDVDKYPDSPYREMANRAAVVRQAAVSPLGSNVPIQTRGGWDDAHHQIEKMYNRGFFNSQQYFWNWNYYWTSINEPSLFPPSPWMTTTPPFIPGNITGPQQFNAVLGFLNQKQCPLGVYNTFELMDPGYAASGCNIFHGHSGSNPSYFLGPNGIGRYSNEVLDSNLVLQPARGWNTGGPGAPLDLTLGAVAATVAAGGSGYSVGQTLGAVGGTGSVARFTITAVNSGAVVTVSVNGKGGAYSVVPPNPVATTSASGSGCTLNVTWDFNNSICGSAPPGHPEEVTAANHQLFHALREYKLFQDQSNGYDKLTLSYLDAKNVAPVWDSPLGGRSVDHRAGTDKVSNIRDALIAQKACMLIQRHLSGGPLLGEATQFRVDKGTLEYTGYSDGVRSYLLPPGPEPAFEGMAAWSLLPDYELLVTKPRTLHHGIGVESEFMEFTEYQDNQDAVRAAEILYGHGIYLLTNGSTPNDFLADADELRAYYQITVSLQPQIGASTVTSIEYHHPSGGGPLSLRTALASGYDFSQAAVRMVYSNGLEVYVNGHDTLHWQPTILGIPYDMDKDSWVAVNPSMTPTYVNFSAQPLLPTNPGHRIDYVSTGADNTTVPPNPAYTMMDGRGTTATYNGFTAVNLRLLFPSTGFEVIEDPADPDKLDTNGLPLPAYPTAAAPVLPPLPATNSANTGFASMRRLQGVDGWFYRAYDLGLTFNFPAEFAANGRYFRYPDLDYDSALREYRYPLDSRIAIGSTRMAPAPGIRAVRGWVAPREGDIRILGTVQSTAGDGVLARILDGFEGGTLWQATISTASLHHHDHLTRHVEAGDLLLFEVDANGSYANDAVTWAPTITYTGASGEPSAAFTAVPTAGVVPLTVQFTATGTGITSFRWDVDDNGTVDSTVAQFNYVYTNVGTYSVRLTVTNANGSGSNYQASMINVTNPPPVTLPLVSQWAQDGYVRESAPNSGQGGTGSSNVLPGTNQNTSTSALRAGDTNGNAVADKRYRAFLSFTTTATPIPSTATITSAKVKIRRGFTANSPPPGGPVLDIANPYFGTGGSGLNLAATDWQFAVPAGQTAITAFVQDTVDPDLWIATLPASSYAVINRNGTTQIRFYYPGPAPGNSSADFHGYFDGGHTVAANRPVLEVVYQP